MYAYVDTALWTNQHSVLLGVSHHAPPTSSLLGYSWSSQTQCPYNGSVESTVAEEKEEGTIYYAAIARVQILAPHFLAVSSWANDFTSGNN